MKSCENAVVRECLTACAHASIQILDRKTWNKQNPPPFYASDITIKGVVWRANTGAATYDGKRFVRFGIPGQPDVIGMFRGGFYFGFECKDKAKPSRYQEWYHTFFGNLGMRIAVVHDYRETWVFLMKWLNEGCMVKRV